MVKRKTSHFGQIRNQMSVNQPEVMTGVGTKMQIKGTNGTIGPSQILRVALAPSW